MHTEEIKRFFEVLAEIKDYCAQAVSCDRCPLRAANVCDGTYGPFDWKIKNR